MSAGKINRENNMKTFTYLLAAALMSFGQAHAQTAKTGANKTKDITNKTQQQEHYTFQISDKVTRQAVTFKNRYGITLAADLYLPKNRGNGPLPALALSGPFGAVKEQSSGLYAQNMAERGFAALAFDPSYTGESGGEPRHVASPDINTEDFSAAVDFLGLQPSVDRNRIGIIGICGWAGMALNATAVDKRVKAVATTSMYDMSRVMAKGYFDKLTTEQRADMLEQMSQQRWADAEQGTPAPSTNNLPKSCRATNPSSWLIISIIIKRPGAFIPIRLIQMVPGRLPMRSRS
jgi:dipeptidyl aminopeptidase/acylaminoacyl peptidase